MLAAAYFLGMVYLAGSSSASGGRGNILEAPLEDIRSLFTDTMNVADEERLQEQAHQEVLRGDVQAAKHLYSQALQYE